MLAVAAADVGSVGDLVAGGGVLPGDGDADVDAEQAGQDSSGQFGGELEQRGGSCLRRVDAEGLEPLSEVAGADGLAGRPPGNSQQEGVSAAVVACPRRPASTAG